MSTPYPGTPVFHPNITTIDGVELRVTKLERDIEQSQLADRSLTSTQTAATR